MTPGLSSMGVGSNWTICELSTRTAVSASRLEPTDDRSTRCSCQKRNSLRDPSLALSDGCNGLRTRSLKLASNRANRHTLKAAPAAAILVSESGATGETKKAAQRFSAIGR